MKRKKCKRDVSSRQQPGHSIDGHAQYLHYSNCCSVPTERGANESVLLTGFGARPLPRTCSPPRFTARGRGEHEREMGGRPHVKGEHGLHLVQLLQTHSMEMRALRAQPTNNAWFLSREAQPVEPRHKRRPRRARRSLCRHGPVVSKQACKTNDAHMRLHILAIVGWKGS